MNTKKILLTLFVSFIAVFAFGQTNYYISPTGVNGEGSPCSAAQPCASIDGVWSSQGGFSDGDTIFIASGHYSGWSEINAANLTNVVLQGAGKESTIIDGGGTTQFLHHNPGLHETSGNLHLNDLTIMSTVSDGENGGALNIGGSSTDTVFIRNVRFYKSGTGSGYNGGAIYINGGRLEIYNCEFDTCYSGNHGGAIAAYSYCSVKIDQSLFYKNSSVQNGSAIFSYSSSFNTTNSIFEYNNALSRGDVYIDASHAGEGIFDHCTFVNNATNFGGTVVTDYGYNYTISNSIFRNNGTMFDYTDMNTEGSAALKNIFYEGIGHNSVGCDACTMNDPGLYDIANRDYRIKASGDAINYAVNSTVSNDFNGYARPGGTNNDCGAIETHCFMPITGLSTTAVSQVSCFGGNDGAVKTVVSGGESPFYFAWGSAEETANLRTIQKPKGMLVDSLGSVDTNWVHVIVQDIFGCDKSDSYKLASPAKLTSTATISSPVTCFGNSDGSVQVNITNGQANYNYFYGTAKDLSDIGSNMGISAATDNLIGQAADSIFIKVEDGLGCLVYDTVDMTQPTDIMLTTLSIMPTCNGENNGIAAVNVSGGNPSYQVDWGSAYGLTDYQTNGAISGPDTLKNIGAGTYYIMVTDANGCKDSISRFVSQPSQLPLSQFGQLDTIQCHGDTSASIEAVIAGEENYIDLYWLKDADGSLDDTLKTLSSFMWGRDTLKYIPSGTYHLHLRDMNNCLLDTTFTILQPTDLNKSIAIDHAISCFGGNDGKINSSVSGGTSPYRYSWGTSPGFEDIRVDSHLVDLNDSISNLTADEYFFKVTDAKGCVEMDSVDLTQPSQVTAVASLTTDNVCRGDAGAIIEVAFGGGNAPYQVDWDTLAGGNELQNSIHVSSGVDALEGLSTDTYFATVADNNGCLANASVMVNEVPELTYSMSLVNNVLCHGDSTGKVSIVFNSNGVGPYDVYFLQDADGSIDDTISRVIGISEGTLDTLEGLFMNNYFVHIYDVNSCLTTSSFNITQPDALSSYLTAADYLACYGDSDAKILSSISGGVQPFHYFWGSTLGDQNLRYDSSNTALDDSLVNIGSGKYYFMAEDSNNCSVIDSITINAPAELIATVSLANGPSCIGSVDGKLRVTVSGGTSNFDIDWGSAQGLNDIEDNISSSQVVDTMPEAGAGTYWVEVTDGNGCQVEEYGIIPEPLEMKLMSFNQLDSLSCSGDSTASITVQMNDHYSQYDFYWHSDEGRTNLLKSDLTRSQVIPDTLKNLKAGSIYFRAENQYGCQKDTSIVILEPNTLSVGLTIDQNIICAGDSSARIIAQGNGGTIPYEYKWGNGPGNYNYKISNSLNNLDTILAKAGDVYITLRDNKGCLDSTNVAISQPTAFMMNPIDTLARITCQNATDGQVKITVSGGVSPYTFNYSSISLSNSELKSISTSNQSDTIDHVGSEKIYIRVVDALGCEMSDSFQLQNPELFSFSLGQDTAMCLGDSIEFEVQEGLASYEWPDGSTGNTWKTFQSQSDSIGIKVSNGSGCTIIDSLYVRVKTMSSYPSVSDRSICYGSSITLFVDMAASYLWSTGSSSSEISIQPLVTTDYWVDVTDPGSQCTIRDSVNVEVKPLPLVDLGLDRMVCQGDVISIDMGSQPEGAEFLWSNGADLSSISFEVTQTDSIVGQVSFDGCVGKDTVVVGLNTPKAFTVSEDSTICENSTITLAVDQNFEGYNWGSQADTLQTYSKTYVNDTVVHIEVEDENGCKQSDSIVITVNANPNLFIQALLDTVCPDETTTIKASGAEQYLWNNGSNQDSVVGKYYSDTLISVIGTDTSTACFKSDSIWIEVHSPVAVSLTNDATINTICEDSTVVFHASMMSADSFEFYLNGPNNMVQSGVSNSYSTTTLNDQDSLAVYGIDNNGCRWFSNIVTMSVEQCITPCPILSADFAYQVHGLTVILSENIEGPVTNFLYDWDGFSQDTSRNPTYSFPMAGYYEVCLTVFDSVSACSEQLCKTIEVLDTINGDSANVICNAAFELEVVSDTLNLTDLSLGTYDKIQWLFEGSVVAVDSQVQRIVDNAGFHQICLAILDSASGCQSTKCENFEVLPQEGSEDTVACLADFTVFTLLDSNRAVFTNRSVGDISRYYWTFDDGASSFEVSPIHDYAELGYYNVTLVTIDDSTGCQSEVSKAISLIDTSVREEACLADFEYFVNLEDTSVAVHSTSRGAITGYNWNFGDGYYADSSSEIHNYSEYGIKDITLTVFNLNSGCQSTLKKTIELADTNQVQEACLANFTFFPDYENRSINLSNEALGNFTRSYWELSNGAISFDSNPSFSIEQNGSYEVCLTIINDNNNCQNEICKTIVFNDTSNQTDSIFCNAEFEFFVAIDSGTVFFNNTSSGDITNYHWSFGDETFSTERAITHRYETEGIYTVELNVYDIASSCHSKYIRVIEVVDSNALSCQAGFSFVPNLEDTTLSLTNQSLGNFDAFYWNFGNGEFGQTEDTVIQFEKYGYYNVCLTVYNAFTQCQSTYCERIAFFDTSATVCEASYDYFPLIDSGVVGAQFINRSEGIFDRYHWNFGDGTFSNEESPYHQFADFGYYGVSLTVFDGLSQCQATILQPVELIDTTELSCFANFTYFPEDDGWVRCDNQSEGTFSEFFWTFGDGKISTEENPRYQYMKNGIYDVTLNVFDPASGCHSVSKQTIEILSDSSKYCQANFDYYTDSTGAVVFNSTSQGTFNQMYWNFGNGTFDTITEPTMIYDEKGFYNVCLTVVDTTFGEACIHSYCEEVVAGPDSAAVTNCDAKFEYFVSDNSVWYNNQSIGAFAEVYWSFGDGNFSNTVDSITHNYDEYGYMQVTLTVIDTSINCFASHTEMVPVLDGGSTEGFCVADFTYIPVGMEDTLHMVNFSDMSYGGPSQFYWSFGDNSAPSFGKNPIHPYREAGYYKVDLTIFSEDGCQETVSKVVPVGDVSNSCYADFSFFVRDEIQGARFRNRSLGEDLTHTWNFGDNVYTDVEHPGHVYNTTGLYGVCLNIETAGGCQDLICKEVKIGVELKDTCTVNCVFPGDADHNGHVNHYDLLPIGLEYAKEGPLRDTISIDKRKYKSTAWSTLQEDGTNNMHADCNGDGVINFEDVVAIDSNKNWSYNRGLRLNQAGNELSFVIHGDVIPSGAVSIDVIGGDDITPLSMYGIGFELGFEEDQIDLSSVSVNWSDTWLDDEGGDLVIDEWGGDVDIDEDEDLWADDWTGDDDIESDDLWSDDWLDEDTTDLLTFDYMDETNRNLWVSGTRTDKRNVESSGVLCNITFNMAETIVGDSLILNLFSNGGVMADGSDVPLANEQIIVAVEEAKNEFKYDLLDVYPNPSNGLVQYHLPANAGFVIRLVDVTGKPVYQRNEIQGGLIQENLNEIPSGLYFLEIKGSNNHYRTRIQIVK